MDKLSHFFHFLTVFLSKNRAKTEISHLKRSVLSKNDQSNLKQSGKKESTAKNIRHQKVFVVGKFRRGKKYSSVKNFVTKRFFRHFLLTKFLPIR